MSKSRRTIREAERATPVREEVDVLVAGGGLGGVAAATAAARAGAKVLLVERNTFLGGVATAGMCCSIFNCYYTGGSPRRLGTQGIAVEVADAFAEAEGYGKSWHDHKGHIIYDIERAKLVLQDLVAASGARMLLGAQVSGVVMDGCRLQGLLVESKSGREAILAKVVVDASGDADVAALSGAPVTVHEKAKQSLCFRLANVDVDAFVQYFQDHPDEYPDYMDVNWTFAEALAQYGACGTFLFPHGGGMQMKAFRQARESGDLPAQIGIQDTTDACQMHALRRKGVVHVVTGFTHFDGLDADMISRSVADGRRMAFAVTDVYRKRIPGFRNAFVAGTGVNLGVRCSRTVAGDFTFTRDMAISGQRFPDAVGRSVGYRMEKRHKGENAWAMHVLSETPFDLPYRVLLPQKVKGLLMGAGRSLSVDPPSVLRVMAHTMVTGQAAGVGAAVAVHRNKIPCADDVAAIQDALREQGVVLA